MSYIEIKIFYIGKLIEIMLKIVKQLNWYCIIVSVYNFKFKLEKNQYINN